eukprot:166121-Ditylum_brightwellii.AAC.1
MSTEDDMDKAKITKCMKDAESKRRMYILLKWYLKPSDNRAGLSQVDVPEWDYAEFVLIVGITHQFHWHYPLQWWFGIMMFPIVDKLVAWRNHCLLLVSHRQTVVKEEMEKVLFHQHKNILAKLKWM